MSSCLLQRRCSLKGRAFTAQRRQGALASALRAQTSGQMQPTTPPTGCPMDRRDLMLTSLALLLASATPGSALAAEQDPKFQTFKDGQLAYTFQYPVETLSGRPLTLRQARGPSTYGAAPILTPDGRQRIVSQLMDLRQNVTITLTVGPAAGVLKEKPPSEWAGNEVAITVLVDRSTARVSSGQRVALNDVEEVKLEERDGSPYWVYEHVSQGSPTVTSPKKDNYRHAVAATTYRPGESGKPYLYTLNLSCPQDLWGDLEPLFFNAVDSFRLLPPSKEYVAPDSNGLSFSLF